MATIHKEIAIERSKEIVWDAIRDVGAIHKRLVPGFVVDCELEGEWRTVSLQMAWSYGNSSSLWMKKTAATLSQLAARLALIITHPYRYSRTATKSVVSSG